MIDLIEKTLRDAEGLRQAVGTVDDTRVVLKKLPHPQKDLFKVRAITENGDSRNTEWDNEATVTEQFEALVDKHGLEEQD